MRTDKLGNPNVFGRIKVRHVCNCQGQPVFGNTKCRQCRGRGHYWLTYNKHVLEPGKVDACKICLMAWDSEVHELQQKRLV